MNGADPLPVTGVILAGGRAERMGGRDKGLVPLAGEALIAHVLRGLRPQVAALLISANRNLATYGTWDCPVVPDEVGVARFRGPLAGMLAALRVAATPYVLTVPCDVPQLPADYARRMWEGMARERATVAVAQCGGCWQPVFALLPVALADDLETWLDGGAGGVGRWLRRHRPATVVFPDAATFANLNTPEQLMRLESQWTGGARGHERNRD